MNISNRAETVVLFLGDLALFFSSLCVTFFIRYGIAQRQLFFLHIEPFFILFAIWTGVFFIAGLYEKQTLFLQKHLPQLLLRAMIANSLIAVLFFYFLPMFAIAPRVNLFIYIFVSFALILIWRLSSYRLFATLDRESALLIGNGNEIYEIETEVNHNPRYNIRFLSSLDAEKLSGADFNKEIIRRVNSENVSLIAVDFRDSRIEPVMSPLYTLLFYKVRFLDTHKLYEEIFDRIPLSLIRHNWFLENISEVSSHFVYDFFKRGMDIAVSILLIAIPIVCYPFVLLFTQLEDGGSVFIWQDRIGKSGAHIKILKFRTMLFDDEGKVKVRDNRVTKVGAFLRRTRLDEFPQLWNVLKGELSLIGPRPELPALVSLYEKEVPFYNARHLITPGLSGWAQLYHKTPPKVDPNSSETAVKLSYDLYYLKNRSLFLDFKIALKTIKVLLSRSGV